MKNYPSPDRHSSGFKNVPVIRLDSGAIRVPVEFIENMTPPRNQGPAVCITVNRGSFWAWRRK